MKIWDKKIVDYALAIKEMRNNGLPLNDIYTYLRESELTEIEASMMIKALEESEGSGH